MKRLIGSCFGLGRLPIAPGTWGSLPPVAFFCLLCIFGAGVLATSILMAALAAVASVLCVRFAPAAIKATGKKDPSEVVLDEFAGQSVTFIAATAGGAREIVVTAVLGFLLFRLFDILKPYPIRKLERLTDGWGVLADDLLAGVYAAISLQICAYYGLTGLFA